MVGRAPRALPWAGMFGPFGAVGCWFGVLSVLLGPFRAWVVGWTIPQGVYWICDVTRHELLCTPSGPQQEVLQQPGQRQIQALREEFLQAATTSADKSPQLHCLISNCRSAEFPAANGWAKASDLLSAFRFIRLLFVCVFSCPRLNPQFANVQNAPSSGIPSLFHFRYCSQPASFPILWAWKSANPKGMGMGHRDVNKAPCPSRLYLSDRESGNFL